MTPIVTKVARAGALALIFSAGVFLDESLLLNSGSIVKQAHAVIGRPLTPMSYAGVARRTTRRAYAAGAYGAAPVVVGAAPVVAAPVIVSPACYQTVDAYGRVFMRCP